MNRTLLFVTLIAVACLNFGTARADLILGSIGFNVDGNISPSSGSLNQAFQLTNVVTNNTADGDWVAFTGGLHVADSINFGVFNSQGNAFSFSDPNFGTFTGQVDLDTGASGSGASAQRTFVMTGLFTPGATLIAQGFNDTTIGQMQVIIQNIAGGGRSASLVFGTAVPEPTSCVLIGFSLIGWVSVRRTRFRRSFRNSDGDLPQT